MAYQKTLYWYDLETFGINPRKDRIAQFAGIRTNEELEIIGEPLTIYCKAQNDMLPDAQACLVTGITPQYTLLEGDPEAEFIRTVNDEFTVPGTCVAGYNNLRFDDEFIRFSLYRNFYDPYAREWKNQNSRWDILDLARVTYALRPDGINWPKNALGEISFKLEDLTKANGIIHESAHDALSDVKATISIARLIRQRQPRLYDYFYQLRHKVKVDAQFNLSSREAVLHTSGMYSVSQGCTTLVAPLARDLKNKNAVYVYDLTHNPTDLLELGVEQIKERIFTKSEDLPEGVKRIALKAVHINKCPIIAPAKTMRPNDAKRLGIDLKECEKHLKIIQSAGSELEQKIQQIFSSDYLEAELPEDPDGALYTGGFFSKSDRDKMDKIPLLDPEDLGSLNFNFDDKRLNELLFRYRARNYFDTLSNDEIEIWNQYLKSKFDLDNDQSKFDLYFEKLNELEESREFFEGQKRILRELRLYGQTLLNDI